MKGNYILLYNEELSVPLRCVRDGTNFRFVATDVCEALDINPFTLSDMLPSCERHLLPVYECGEVAFTGGEVDDRCPCISIESVYTLCAVSTLNTANLFKKWFTEEVLPWLHGDAGAHNLGALTDQIMCLRDRVERIEDKLK